MANRWGKSGNSGWLYFFELQNHCRWWLQPWNWKTLVPLEKRYNKPRQYIKKQIHHFTDKGLYGQSYGFSSSIHVWIYELSHKEGWKWKWSHSVMSNSAAPWTVAHQVLHPWNFPGKSTGVGCHFLLQGIFLTQGLNLGLQHCRQMLFTVWATREALKEGWEPKNWRFQIAEEKWLFLFKMILTESYN